MEIFNVTQVHPYILKTKATYRVASVVSSKQLYCQLTIKIIMLFQGSMFSIQEKKVVAL